MAVLAVIVLGALGLGMIVFGIVALRDEPPRWMLIKHPGRVLLLGFVPLIAAFIINTLRFDIEEEIRNDTGQSVSCEKVGPLEIAGDERQVYACVTDQSGGAHIGCYARVGDGVMEVTEQAQRPGAFDGQKPDC